MIETKDDLLKQEEVYTDSQGNLRWASGNIQGKRAGSFAERPLGAAPLLNPALVAQYKIQRAENRQISAENQIIQVIETIEGRPLDFTQAVGIIAGLAVQAGITKNNAALLKIGLNLAGALEPENQTMNIKHANILQIASIPHYDQSYIDAIIRDAPDYARQIVDQADWTGREELQTYARRALNNDDSPK